MKFEGLAWRGAKYEVSIYPFLEMISFFNSTVNLLVQPSGLHCMCYINILLRFE